MQFVFENTTETTESVVKINAIKESSPASVATFTHKHVEIPGSIYLLSASKQSIVHEGGPDEVQQVYLYTPKMVTSKLRMSLPIKVQA